MKIAIDIDDTICDTWEYSLPFFSEYYKIDLELLKQKITYRYNIQGFTNRAYLTFLKECQHKFINDVPLKENVREVINQLKKDNEIIFITARSDKTYKDAYQVSSKYLKQNKIYYDKLYVSGGNKAEICKKENVDLLIDDNIDNCLKTLEIGIDILCFNPDKEINLESINTWNEVIEYIERRKNGYKNSHKRRIKRR